MILENRDENELGLSASRAQRGMIFLPKPVPGLVFPAQLRTLLSSLSLGYCPLPCLSLVKLLSLWFITHRSSPFQHLGVYFFTQPLPIFPISMTFSSQRSLSCPPNVNVVLQLCFLIASCNSLIYYTMVCSYMLNWRVFNVSHPLDLKHWYPHTVHYFILSPWSGH